MKIAHKSKYKKSIRRYKNNVFNIAIAVSNKDGKLACPWQIYICG